MRTRAGGKLGVLASWIRTEGFPIADGLEPLNIQDYASKQAGHEKLSHFSLIFMEFSLFLFLRVEATVNQRKYCCQDLTQMLGKEMT